MSWNKALTNYSETKDPSTLPKEVLLAYDEHTITIHDLYNKAQYHCLVLPRMLFPLPSTESTNEPAPVLSSAGGKLTLGSTSSSSVPPSHLRNLRSLLSSPYAQVVLSHLESASSQALRLIQDKMRAEHGQAWPIHRGFHAIPSMEHVHLHVISNDLVSPRLKHKKHYLSFHPSHGLFLHLEALQQYVAEGRKSLPHSTAHYESLLKGPLVSFRNGQTYANMPKLSQHLQRAWQEALAASKRKNPPSSSPSPVTTKRRIQENNETEAKPET